MEDNKKNKENIILKQQLPAAIISRDQTMIERNRYLNELIEIRNSKTYKLATVFMKIPRKLRGYRYKYGELPDYQKSYSYMISVVIAVYNTADFLSEMIESVLAQKQDILSTYLRSNPDAIFREHVYENIYELILIDDGSDDGSEDICDEYAAKYPWIKVLHKENGGVSSARNAGIEIASGKYITFPDSDDKISEDVFEKCFIFFEDHEDEISMVTYPLRFFDGKQGEHWTTYRFENGTRILNMLEEWDKPQYFTASSFFKTENLKAGIFYDSSLINGEDIKLANDVIFHDMPSIGLISDCTYWYRRRSTGNQSAIQQSKSTEKYYVSYVTDMLGYLMSESRIKYGEIPKYIQYTVMGQLQRRLMSDEDGTQARAIIGKKGFEKYRDQIKALLKSIDMDVILSQRCLYREHRFYAAMIKSGGEVERLYGEGNIKYFFEEIPCADAGSCYVKLEFMKIKKEVLKLEGLFSSLESGVQNWLMIGKDKYFVNAYEKRDASVRVLDETALYVEAFTVEIPLESVKDKDEIVFGSTIGEHDVIRTNITLGKFMPITKQFSYSYYAEEKWIIRLEKNKLAVWNMFCMDSFFDFESDFRKQVLLSNVEKNKEIKNAIEIREAAISRINWLNNCGSKKQIWLISDRYSIADDNGEVLFTYLSEMNNPNIQPYFVIDRESSDYDRLSQVGNVVVQDSNEHLILQLIADCIISSQADEYIIDPVWRKGLARHVFKDLYSRRRYVFLQHGVIKDDLSRWLNRYK